MGLGKEKKEKATHPDFGWKAADERVASREVAESAGLLVVLYDPVTGIKKADELDAPLQKLAASPPRGAEDDDLTFCCKGYASDVHCNAKGLSKAAGCADQHLRPAAVPLVVLHDLRREDRPFFAVENARAAPRESVVEEHLVSGPLVSVRVDSSEKRLKRPKSGVAGVDVGDQSAPDHIVVILCLAVERVLHHIYEARLRPLPLQLALQVLHVRLKQALHEGPFFGRKGCAAAFLHV